APPSSLAIAASFALSRPIKVTRSSRARSARAIRTPMRPVAPTTSTRRERRAGGGGADRGADVLMSQEVSRLQARNERFGEANVAQGSDVTRGVRAALRFGFLFRWLDDERNEVLFPLELHPVGRRILLSFEGPHANAKPGATF